MLRFIVCYTDTSYCTIDNGSTAKKTFRTLTDVAELEALLGEPYSQYGHYQLVGIEVARESAPPQGARDAEGK